MNGRANTRRRRRSPFDLTRLHQLRDRVAPAAPLVVGGSLIALAVSGVAGLPGAIQLVLVAVACGALLTIESEQQVMRRELRRARVKAVDAVELERLRIQHDLHDSVQQRLVSVRIRLDDLPQSGRRAGARDSIEKLGREIDAALSDIRAITLSSTPQVLLGRGLREALRATVAYSPLRVSVDAPAFRRYPPEVERCVYFCCLEALQNVVKHAGRSARAWIRVTERPGRLVFEVEDSGVGFDAGKMQPGRGLTGLADRVGALGGRIGVDSRPGFGTHVQGEVPLVM